MHFENCPHWICESNGIPRDIFYLIGFLLIVAPYSFLFKCLIRKSKFRLSTLGLPISIFMYLIGLCLYLALICYMTEGGRNDLAEFVLAVALSGLMWGIWIVPTLLVVCVIAVVVQLVISKLQS